jgi:predicted PurR-regulated permease PerM
MPDTIPITPIIGAGAPPPGSQAGTESAAKVMPVAVPNLSALLTLAVFVVVVAALYLAREVLVPITLAVLLSFVLAPLVELLRRIYVPRVAAVLLSVVTALGIILALGGLIGMQLANLATDLPRYQHTMEEKVRAVQAITIGQLSQVVDRLGRQLPQSAQPAPQAGPAEPKPTRVEVLQPPLSPLTLAERVLTPVLSPLATVGITFIVAIFVLLQQDDLRDRLIRLFGSSDLHRTTEAMDDAGRRLSRYFLTQLAINAGFGAVVFGGLLVIGVPSPALWAVLGALLRFVPYIGTWISGLLPIAMAAAVDPGWSMAISTLILYGVTELIAGQVIEPFLYGHSTGLSPISVVVAAIFWSWLWGPIGLILSTPLTLCLVVLGRHVPRLEFLDVMLGDRPALTPVESFYQRILAGDADEALDQAEMLLRDRSLSSYYDEVVIRGIQLATVDIARGALPMERVTTVSKTLLELIGDLASHNDREPDAKRSDFDPVTLPERETALPTRPVPGPDFAGDGSTPPWSAAEPVLCIAGRGPLDDAAAAMLTQLLGKHGVGARAVPHAAVARGNVSSLDPATIAMVCICYVEISGSPSHLRYLLRRLRQHLPGVPILVGLWPLGEQVLHDERLRRAIGADLTASTLTDTVNLCLREAETAPAEQTEPVAA